jgi:hypothetical protein
MTPQEPHWPAKQVSESQAGSASGIEIQQRDAE